MDDIAKEAGFTKPILYQFFQSKTELYKEIVEDIATSMIHSLSKAVSNADAPRAKIEVAFRVYFDMVVSDTDAFRILFIHAHDGETAGELRKLETGLISFMVPYIDLSISDEHRRQLAAGVLGIAEGAAVVWLVQQEAKGWSVVAADEAERLAARSATLAWGGLRAVQQD
jgi:AcrR family transcriptional regulator